MNYSITELSSRRRIAQRDLAIMIKRMRIHQNIYDKIRSDYDNALRIYNKLDLLYAEKTKLTNCKPKGVKNPSTSTKPYNPIPAKLRKIMAKLDPATIEAIIQQYEGDKKDA